MSAQLDELDSLVDDGLGEFLIAGVSVLAMRELLDIVTDLTPIDGGYRVKLSRDGRHYVDVMKMLFNWRVVTTPVRLPCTYDRGWCYFGTGPASFRNAVMAALVWSGSDLSEPAGYDKRIGPPPLRLPQRHGRRHRNRLRRRQRYAAAH